MAKKVQTYDITKLGPQRFNELQRQNMEMQGTAPLPDLFPDLQRSYNVTTHNPLQNRQQDVMSPLNTGEGDYWGASRFDESIANDADFAQLGTVRAENQSGFNKVLNGTVKMGSTAVTTFLDGTVGALYGLIQGGANLLDNDPDTGFWQGMWDNDFNKAMADAQDAMERIAPNYYTERELNNPWYKNIFSANFLGDKLLKNAGFTIGALATMSVPGVGVAGEVASAGVSGLGKLIAASKFINNAEKAAGIARGFKQAGGLAQKFVNSFVSANGEAAIESINAVRANDKAVLNNIQNWGRDARLQAEQEYRTTGNRADYERNLASIDQAERVALNEAASTMRGLGNSVYFGNVALLMLTNNLEFGKYIKGGWNPQKGINDFRKKVAGEAVEDMTAFGRGIARGTARVEIPEEVGKLSVGRVVGGTLARMGEEGFEEGAQNIISDSGQMQSQAKVNAWARKNYGENSLFAASINPDVTEDLVDRMKAIGEAWSQNFGSGFDAPGWEEVFLGALTGGIGTISVHTDPVTKKWNVWQGGLIEEIRKPKEELRQAEKIASAFNDYVQSEDFRKRTRHAVAGLSFAGEMEDAIARDDIMAFKNAELMAVVNDALYFRESGALDAYKGFYEEMAKQVTDADIADVKALIRGIETGKSWFDTKTNEELHDLLQEKAKSTLAKIEDTLNTYDTHVQLYADKFAKAAEGRERGARLAEASLQELTAKAVLIDDLQRRKKELEEKRDSVSQTTRALRGENFTSQIKEIDDKIEKLNKEYEDYIAHPEHLIDSLQKKYELYEKIQIGKDAEKAKERLKTATTLQQVADFYFSTEPEIRQKVFDKATREAEGPAKDLLMSFRPFLGTLNSLSNLIDKKAQEYAKDLYDEAYSYEGDVSQHIIDQTLRMADMQRRDYEFAFKQEVQNVVESFLEDPEASFSKKTLEQALLERATELLTDPNLNREGGNAALISFMAGELRDLAHSVKTLDDTYRESAELREELAKRKEAKEASKKEETPAPKKEEKPATPTYSLELTVGAETTPIIPDEESGEELLAPEEEPEEENPESAPEVKRDFAEIPTEGMSDQEADFVEDVLNTGTDEPLPKNVSEETPEFVEDSKESEVSFRGNAFHRYKTSRLTADGTAKPEAAADSFYKLLQDKGIDIDYIHNNYLSQLLKAFDGKLPVRYMIMNGRNRGETEGMVAKGKLSGRPHIFLVTPYYGETERIVKRTDPQAAGNIITSQGTQYLVVGCLGYSSRATALQKQHTTIGEKLLKRNAELREAGTPEEFVVGTDRNFIYGMTPGYVIRRMDKEDTKTVPADMDLATLMQTANPKGLTLTGPNGLKWLVLEGKNPTITARENFKWINFSEEDKKGIRKPSVTEHPGKVYLYLPASDGTFIPQYVTPIRFRNLSEKNGKVWEDIQRAIKNLAQSKSVEERKAAMQELRNLFVFNSNLGGAGTNIFYDEKADVIHYAVADLVRRGEQKTIDFNTNPSEEEVTAKITEMLADTNPRFRVNTRTLADNPGYYVNNGVFKVNLRSLGTVDARSYVYPIAADGTPIVDFKASVPEGTKEINKPMVVYFEDNKYSITHEPDGTTVVSDADGNVITDKTLLREMTDIMLITTGRIPFTSLTAVGNPDGKRYEYYISTISTEDADTFVYVRKGAGSYRRLAGADLATFRSRLNYHNNHLAQTEAIGAELAAAPASTDFGTTLFDTPVSTEEAPKEAPQPTSGEEPVGKIVGDTVESVAKNANFVREILNDPDAQTRLFELVPSDSIKEAENKIRKSKYGELYLKVADPQSLQDLLDTIEECGL